MKTFSEIFLEQKALKIVAEFNAIELEDLERAIALRKNALMVERLKRAGFSAMTEKTFGDGNTVRWNLIMVWDPADKNPGEWATIEECRRLLDIAANLPATESFSRWREKVEQIDAQPYTKADALADMRAEVSDAERMYAAGKIDAETLAVMNKNARTTLENVSDAARALGSVRSAKKARASVENGKLGGRPRQTVKE